MKNRAYLVVWWMAQIPHAALFESRIAAEAAAGVRNALMVTVSGDDVQVESVLDWYRRNDEGQPMPAEWRDILGQIRVPWPGMKAAAGERGGAPELTTPERAPVPRPTRARRA